MAGYTRQSNFTDGDVIQASDSNDEFNQILASYNNVSGHAHDGTAGEGPVIGLIGDAGSVTPLNKLAVDTTSDRFSFYIDVASVSTEQVRVEDGTVYPVTTNDIDLGTAVYMFKDGFFAGTLQSVNLQTTNIKANDGTLAATIDDSTGVFNIVSASFTTASISGGTIDNTVIGSTTPLAGNFTTLGATGDITVVGTVDGRDVALDGTKLDGIEALADITDTTNVEAAGALMDSELSDLVAVKAIDQGLATSDDVVFNTVDGRDVSVDGTKLDTIETNADVTDTANVEAAGALMDSEVTNLSQVKSFDSSDYEATDPTILRDANIGVDVQAFDTNIVSDASYVATDENFTTADHSKLDGIEALADVTDTTNVEAAGALMDSEVDVNIKTLVLPADTTITTFGASFVDDSDAETARTTLDVDQAGTALALAIALG